MATRVYEWHGGCYVMGMATALETIAKYNDTSVECMRVSLNAQFVELRNAVQRWRKNESVGRMLPVTDSHLCTWLSNRGPVGFETVRHSKAGPAWLELAREAIKGY